MLMRLPRRTRQIPAVAVATGLLLIGASGCGSSGPSSKPRAGHALVSIFEAGPQLRVNPVRTMATLRRLGVDVVKVFLPWREVAPQPNSPAAPAGFDPTDPGAYPAGNWARWDAIVRAATARGVGVDLTVSRPPLWAHGPHPPKPGLHPQWRTSPPASR